MGMSQEEAIEQFRRQKSRSTSMWLVVYLLWGVTQLIPDRRLQGSYELIAMVGTVAAYCCAFVLYYRSRRCPNCRKANLFFGPQRISCRNCGIQLLKADESRGQWRMMLGLGVFYMLPVVVILALALESRPIWLAATSILLFVVVFIGGPFLLHKYHRKLV